MNDSHIIELYFARDEQAIRETETAYGKLLFRIAYNILQDDEDAKEIVNDTYLGLWNAIPPAKPQYFGAFAAKIARNLSLKKLTSLAREKRSPSVLLSLDELASVLPDDRFNTDMDEKIVSELISRFLRKQKTVARDIFIRKYYFFDSVADIAVRFSLSESKVKNILFVTRKKLKICLQKEGIDV